MTEDRSNSSAGKSAASARTQRKFRSKLERRKIAEEALTPGASVANVARAHGVRANQVRHWRRLYSQGLLNEAASTALVPVTITDMEIKEPATSAMTLSTVESQTPARGTIRIETEKARV